jgi:hypothetical protein
MDYKNFMESFMFSPHLAIVFFRDDSGIHDENSFVALVSLNFWHGQPLCQKGIGVGRRVFFAIFMLKLSRSFVILTF